MVEVDRVVDARRPQGVALQVQRLVAVALRDADVAGRGRADALVDAERRIRSPHRPSGVLARPEGRDAGRVPA